MEGDQLPLRIKDPAVGVRMPSTGLIRVPLLHLFLQSLHQSLIRCQGILSFLSLLGKMLGHVAEYPSRLRTGRLRDEQDGSLRGWARSPLAASSGRSGPGLQRRCACHRKTRRVLHPPTASGEQQGDHGVHCRASLSYQRPAEILAEERSSCKR